MARRISMPRNYLLTIISTIYYICVECRQCFISISKDLISATSLSLSRCSLFFEKDTIYVWYLFSWCHMTLIGTSSKVSGTASYLLVISVRCLRRHLLSIPPSRHSYHCMTFYLINSVVSDIFLLCNDRAHLVVILLLLLCGLYYCSYYHSCIIMSYILTYLNILYIS